MNVEQFDIGLQEHYHCKSILSRNFRGIQDFYWRELVEIFRKDATTISNWKANKDRLMSFQLKKFRAMIQQIPLNFIKSWGIDSLLGELYDKL